MYKANSPLNSPHRKKAEMRKKLDILFGRTSRQISKLKSLLSLTVSRIAFLRNQSKVRCNQARGDIAQILQLHQLDRALLRAEQVIKQQNMLDVFLMIEGHCNLITERASLLDHAKECPEELREAVAGLIFATSRCGELPELQSVRAIFASKFGKEFTSACTELRNQCGVSPNMIKKMSTRPPSLEIKQKVVDEIAAAKGIKLELDELSNEIAEEKSSFSNNRKKHDQKPAKNLPTEAEHGENPSTKAHINQYRNAETAALAAFDLANYTAAAAKAAAELSRAESQGKGSDDKRSLSSKKSSEFEESKRARDDFTVGNILGKSIDYDEDDNSESEEDTSIKDFNELLRKNRILEDVELERSPSSSDTEIQSYAVKNRNTSSKDLNFTRKNKQLDPTFHEGSSSNHQISYSQLQPPYRKERKPANAKDHIRISVQENPEKKGKTKDDLEISDSETRSQSQKHHLDAKKLNFRTSATSMRTRRGLGPSEDNSSSP